MFVDDEYVIRLGGLLGAWIELAKQVLGLLHHRALVSCLFGRLTLDVALFEITEASTDHQLNGSWLARPEGEVERVVSNRVSTEHLIFEIFLIWLIFEFSLAELPLCEVALTNYGSHES